MVSQNPKSVNEYNTLLRGKNVKKFIFIPLYYALSTLFLPFLISNIFSFPAPEQITQETEATVSVFNHLTNESSTMKLEDYLVGVVAAEMPASFETEALKAQAVAARTYTFYKAGSSTHEEDVCTDSSHCQAYYTTDDMTAAWGNDFAFYSDRIKNAVYSTEGEYLTYNDEPAMAVFHSMGGGKTENSSDVWGAEIPYLVSVDSPGEEAATNYTTETTIPLTTFLTTITQKYPSARVSSFLDVSEPVLTEGGHVKSIIIGGVSIPGTEIRNLFNLRSTKFDINFSHNDVIFSVTGYGHGVGMSQYGANAMAKSGKTYKEILSHYYQGTKFNE